MADIFKNIATDILEGAVEQGRQASEAMEEFTAPEPESWYNDQRKAQRNYQYRVYQYPINDLGVGQRHPYFMTFYINTQDLSKYNNKTSKGLPPLSTAEIHARTSRTLAKNLKDTGIGFGRKTHRTNAAIRLFMPNTLSWNFRNSFEHIDLSGLPGTSLGQSLAAAPALGRSLAEGFVQGGFKGGLASLNSIAGRQGLGAVAELGEGVAGLGSQGALSAFGIAINPQVDVIFKSPELRTFNFEFLFAPRSLAEATKVQEIIQLFRFHAAPELLAGEGLGRYFVPPSEFDIEFSINTLGKISTCVLEDIAVDYAPTGGAHFYNSDHPIMSRMTLQFRELEFITKELIGHPGDPKARGF